MSDDFDSIRSQAMKYAIEMNNKSTNNNNNDNYYRYNKQINSIFNNGTNKSCRGSGDFSLILMLIILLSNDSADIPLILALMYILT